MRDHQLVGKKISQRVAVIRVEIVVTLVIIWTETVEALRLDIIVSIKKVTQDNQISSREADIQLVQLETEMHHLQEIGGTVEMLENAGRSQMNDPEIAKTRDQKETILSVSTRERETVEEEKVQGEMNILEDERGEVLFGDSNKGENKKN